MTRKDYVAIAAVLKSEQPFELDRYKLMPDWNRGTYDEWGTICLAMCSMLAADNPCFDRARFLKACGVQQ